MKLYIVLALNIIWLLGTCKSKEEGIAVERLKTDQPIKLLVGGSKGDSTKIFIYIPQELKIKNNYSYKVRLSQAFISLNGGNIMAGNELYQMTDSLYFVRSKKYLSGEEQSYLLYTGFSTIIHNLERDSLKAQGEFAQILYSSEVYNISNSEKSRFYVKRKIADSLWGYMHFNFNNPEKNEGFYENIPVEF